MVFRRFFEEHSLADLAERVGAALKERKETTNPHRFDHQGTVGLGGGGIILVKP